MWGLAKSMLKFCRVQSVLLSRDTGIICPWKMNSAPFPSIVSDFISSSARPTFLGLSWSWLEM